MLANNLSILKDYNSVCICVDLDRPPNGFCLNAVFVPFKAHQTGSCHRNRLFQVTNKWPFEGDQAMTFFLEYLPNRLVREVRVGHALGAFNHLLMQASI